MGRKVSRLHVECRYEAGGRTVPLRFGPPGRVREVEELLDHWPGEDSEYFRLRADDGLLYILRRDLRSAHWEITFLETRTQGEG